jgi:hypothetical protein
VTQFLRPLSAHSTQGGVDAVAHTGGELKPVFPPSRHFPRVLSAVAVALAIAAGALPVAHATHTCPATSVSRQFVPSVDPALRTWDVEGKISAYSLENRTVTVNGLTLVIPPTLKVKTLDLDQPEGNLEFADGVLFDAATGAGLDLTDPGLDAIRTIIGGTMIAGGTLEFTTAATGTCMTLTANSVFIQPADSGIIGPLMGADGAAGTLLVNGSTIKMSMDPRFPSDLLDLEGAAITPADLVGYQGALVNVSGYYDAQSGILMGTLVQAEVLKPSPDRDNVAIEAASFAQGRLHVIGALSMKPDGTFASSVDVYVGTINAAGTGCSGTKLGTAATGQGSPGLVTFDFNWSLGSEPPSVCVVSPGGNVAEQALNHHRDGKLSHTA